MWALQPRLNRRKKNVYVQEASESVSCLPRSMTAMKKRIPDERSWPNRNVIGMTIKGRMPYGWLGDLRLQGSTDVRFYQIT